MISGVGDRSANQNAQNYLRLNLLIFGEDDFAITVLTQGDLSLTSALVEDGSILKMLRIKVTDFEY